MESSNPASTTSRSARSRRSFLRGLGFVGSIAACIAIGSPGAKAQVGPGLGNLDCQPGEVGEPIADIANPYPEFFGPAGHNVVSMVRGYLMVPFTHDHNLGNGRISYFDISNPRAPTHVHRVDASITGDVHEQHSLSFAWIEGELYLALATVDGVQIFRVTDPLNTERVGIFRTTGLNGFSYDNSTWQTFWHGRHLFATASNQGLFVLDAANPTNPTLIKRVPTGSTGGFRLASVYGMGDKLIVSNMDQDGLFSWNDIRDPGNPALISVGSVDKNVYSLLLTGDRFYLAGRMGEFFTFDTTDVYEPSFISEVNIGDEILYFAQQDEFILAGKQHAWDKVDVSNETNPVVVQSGTLGVQDPDHGQVTVLGHVISIGNDHGTGNKLFCHAVGRDTRPPVVSKIVPADGEVHVARETAVTIFLTDNIELDSIGPSSVIVRPVGGAALAGIYTYVPNVVTFQPTNGFAADTTYEVVVQAGGLEDVAGNALAETHTVQFSTGAQVVGTPGDGGVPTQDGGTSTDGGTMPDGGSIADGGVTSDGGMVADGGAGGGPGGVDPGSDTGGCSASGRGNASDVFFVLLAILGLAVRPRRRA